MTMFDQVLAITEGKTAEENPGYRLVLNGAHLEQWGQDLSLADFDTIRVFGYPIRLDESVSEMRLEPA